MAEVCADANWLPQDRRDQLEKMVTWRLPHPKDARPSVEFLPCPDCGYDKYPLFDREDEMVVGHYCKVIHNPVRAHCIRCGWTTALHKNVKECAKEWNEAEV